MVRTIIDNFSDEEFIKIVEETDTYKEMCEKLGYNSSSNDNVKKIKTRINKLKLDTSKFKKHYPKWKQKYNTKKIIEELIEHQK